MKVVAGIALGLVVLLTGCGGGNSAPAATSSSASSSPSAEQTTVQIAVVHANVLLQSCESLSGIYHSLHTGTSVTVEDTAAHVVGRGHLGKPPEGVKIPHGVCAWGADVKADVEKGQRYTVRVGQRWSKQATAAVILAGQKRIVIEAK